MLQVTQLSLVVPMLPARMVNRESSPLQQIGHMGTLIDSDAHARGRDMLLHLAQGVVLLFIGQQLA